MLRPDSRTRLLAFPRLGLNYFHEEAALLPEVGLNLDYLLGLITSDATELLPLALNYRADIEIPYLISAS